MYHYAYIALEFCHTRTFLFKQNKSGSNCPITLFVKFCGFDLVCDIWILYRANLLMFITLKDLEIDFGYTPYNVFWIGC